MTGKTIIGGTESTPQVEMDPQEGWACFGGTSWPEDALTFFEPILQWFTQYFQAPKETTKIDFKFIYFNTASAKQLAKLFTIIKDNIGKTKLEINWYYEDGDTEMLHTGERYSKLLGLKFNFVEMEEQDDSDDDTEEGVYDIVK